MSADSAAKEFPREGPSGDARALPEKSLSLTRLFSITSLIGLFAVLAVLLLFYRSFALNALQEHASRNNEAITQIFANTFWTDFADYVRGASAIARGELPRRPEVTLIHEAVGRQLAGLPVVKVKIYNLSGLTVFSSDPAQIGEDKSQNAGFLSAKAGKTASEMTFRDSFSAFEGVISDRNLISSYVPIRSEQQAPVEGVMEVYTDVTDYVGELELTQWKIVAVAFGSLTVLYLFLFAIVRRAASIIAGQGEEVRAAHAAVLRHQTLHDPLTGLPNRANFVQRLDIVIKSAKRSGEKCAVLSLGLDGFKGINESLGHVVGDRILEDVARRLKNCLREADITARIGGDEFAVVLLENLGEGGVERVVSAAEKVRAAILNNPFTVGSHSLAITTGIGMAIFPDDGDDAVELLKSADTALDHAKSLGRNNYQFHTADKNARVLESLLLEHDLRRAVEEQQFVLHYQPRVDLRTGCVTGAEALVRWQHPFRGVVQPAQFIPLAEERGLIVPLGEWVLREACRQNKAWQAAGLPAHAVAVNVSAVQFQQKNFAEVVTNILHESGLAAEYLEIELTESALVRDAEKTIVTMSTLKAIGIRLALDDFGTGYSSLSQLKYLPLDDLKIDRSFVQGLPGDADDLALSSAIIVMGKALKLKVIAEGIESMEPLQVLQALGCDELQGYFIAKPLSPTDFVRFIHERKFTGFLPQDGGSLAHDGATPLRA